MPGLLVVAGLWARPLAESARQGGWRVIALDLFGDVDTRRASVHWSCIGDPAGSTIDPALLREALQQAAGQPGVIGWVAGSGFEGQPQALEQDLPKLPLLGMAAAAVRRLRDPAIFFPTLDRLGLPHPDVALQPPAAPAGWLLKSAGGSGGWHIRPAGRSPADASSYWQRVQPGEPMSALFLADGQRARLVALNRLLVRPLGALPYVYHGAIGPVRDERLARRLQEALDALVPAFGLRGLASLDFLAAKGQPWLLEVNPRPSATMELHGSAWPGGLMRAHVAAVRGDLPQEPAAWPPGLRGSLTVYAERDCRVGAALAAELVRTPHCHDLPAPDTRFASGQPVCNVSAEAEDAAAVLARLEERASHVRARLLPAEALAP